jgi:predicted RNA-binding Zn-ribbon protein involved in translation (DUF1610 family)
LRAAPRRRSSTKRARAWLDENRSALRQRLRDAGIAACPACGNDTIELSEDPLKFDAADDGTRKPTLQFECTHCGHLLFFDAHKLGYPK